MFWRFGGYANVSTLDSVLDKPDVTLEILLDESDLIQELKQQNSKLIEFLREEEALKKLLDYVILDPKSSALDEAKVQDLDIEARSPRSPTRSDKSRRKDGDKPASKMSFFARSRSRSTSISKEILEPDDYKLEQQRRKYAYVATEVLSSEVWSLTEAMFEYPDQLRTFWEYIRRPAPLDPVQAGYFTKINDMLLDKKTEEMFAFLKSLDGIVPEMLKHVDSPMVMDLLLKMVSMEKAEGGQGIVDWLQMQGLVPILLSYLGPENPVPTQTAAGDFLKAIITISANATGQDQTVIGPNELTRQLVSEKCVTKLIQDMLHGGNPLTVGVGIVIEVIRKNNSDYDLDGQIAPEPRTTDPIYLGTLLRAFAKAIPDFVVLVQSSGANRPTFKVAFGEHIQPLGFDRFKTCELMAELLHCSNMGLLNDRGADAEMRARDAERERLKAEGSLKVVALGDSTTDEPFASSVDSHGFHHARAPDDEFGESPERVSKFEIQNASDEDGFENVAVSDANPLPDEVTFGDMSPKVESKPFKALSPLKPSKTSEKSKDDIGDGDGANDAQDTPQEKRRVSLLTKQIQDQIDEVVSDDQKLPVSTEDQRATALRPEDKPAPLFASKAVPTKGVDPILGQESPRDESEPGSHSIATLQPASRDEDELADLPYESEADGSPVIGDLLKMQFVENEVVPTILDFFFRFPWNNFLHNVVYDIVQQVFNGSLDRGYNRAVAQSMFTTSKSKILTSNNEITQRILDGHAASEKSVKQRGMRLGYMGHLTLIAEEVCKFAERHQADLLGEVVMEKVTTDEWVTYVEGILSDTRDRDNAILGGVRPEHGIGIRSIGGGSLLSQGGYGNQSHSSALANAGLMAPSDVPRDTVALDAPLEDFGCPDDDRADLDGLGDVEDADLDDDGRGRGSALLDDEQILAEIDSFSNILPSASSSTADAPRPLNVTPSRARRQLAARLAQRRREAEQTANTETFTRGRSSSSSEQSSPSSEDEIDLLAHGTVGDDEGELSDDDVEHGNVPGSGTARNDPDAADSIALAAADKLGATEPIGNETAASAIEAPRHPGLKPSKPSFSRSSASGSARLPRLSSFDHDEDSDSPGFSDDDDPPVRELPLGRRPSAGIGDAFPRLGKSLGSSTSLSALKGNQTKEERKNSRPVTTEAKVRRPIEGSDSDSSDDGGMRDRAGSHGEGSDGDTSVAAAADARAELRRRQSSQTNIVIGTAREQSEERQQQNRAARSALLLQQQKRLSELALAGRNTGGIGGAGSAAGSAGSSGDDDEGDSEDDVIEIRPRRG